jgi:hypothetical protein
MSYILPQVQVFQEFSVLPTAVVKNLNAFVFGPNYQLFRYAEASEKELIGLGAYDKDSDTAYPWPNQPVDSQVDLDYVKLYMEDVWAQYLQIPASTTAPLIMASVNQRNKLRAAPVIGAAANSNTDSPIIEAEGYFTGHVDLPEDYYFYPVGGADGANAWDETEYESNLDDGAGTKQDARLGYVTTEGLAGHVDVLATDNPMTNLVRIPGPDGLILDIDNGLVDNVWTSPRVIKIADATGDSYINISVDLDAIQALIDSDIDDAKPLSINVSTARVATYTFDAAADMILNIGFNSGVVTLTELKDALELDSDVATYFDISEVLGAVANGALTCSTAVDRAATDVDTGVDVGMIPSATRIRVTPNAYLFASGYGYTNSTHFKERGVAVGDRVRYQVQDESAVTHVGTTKVTGFEADPTLAQVQQPTAKETNQVLSQGSSLVQFDDNVVPAGDGDIVVAGSDNQRTFNGPNTTVMALSGTKFSGELSQGVVADKYTVEITTPGLAGTAQATVSNASGTYYRENVPIEAPAENEERTTILCLDTASVAQGNYFLIEDSDANKYQVWLDIDADGTAPAAIAGGYVQTICGIATGDTDAQVAVKVAAVLDALPGMTAAAPATATLTVEDDALGVVADAVDGDTGFTITTTVQGSEDTDGQIYIGNNLVVNFHKTPAEADAEFQAFDTFTFSQNLEAPYTPVAGLSLIESSGTYTGYGNTTYVVDVVRGGVFDRNTNAYAGIQSAPTAVLTSDADWDDWTGGDVDDEYIVKCIGAGTLSTAIFSVESLNGDSVASMQFSGGAAADVAIGGRGVVAQFDVDDSFSVGDYYVIKVNAARPQVRITDSAGIDQGAFEVVNNGVDFNLGGWGAQLQFKANTNTENSHSVNGGLLKGEVFFVSCLASTNGAIRTLVLADDLPAAATAGTLADGSSNSNPSEFGVWFYLIKSSVEIGSKMLQSPPDYNWVAAEDDVTVNQDIAVQDSSWYDPDGSQPFLPVYQGDVFVEYRALVIDYSNTIHNITDISDVSVMLGTIHPDNPLAQGVYNTLSNSGDRMVFFMGVPTDDHDGYLRVLDRASLNEDVYAFAPLSRDRQVLNSVEAHINDMSTETNKRWRIGFVGTDMDTEASVYDKSKNPAAEEYFCLIADDPSEVGSQYTVLTFVGDDGDPSIYTVALDDVVVGDKVRVNFATDAWNDSTYEEYEVESVDSNTQLTLKAGPPVPLTIATKVEIWHEFNVQEMADDVANTSAGFANRRMYHIFPDVLGAFGTPQTAEFGAAAVAGLCSSVAPQQGLTNIELNGFDDLPQVYSTFNAAQLNKMAEYGTMIIMQDVAGGRIYIRHQVSSNAQSGDLNQTELSITKNLDSISFYFAERLEPYIGRFNVTPALLEVLRVQIKDGIYFLGAFTNVGLLGPQLILDNSELRTLEQHPTLKDHVIAIVDVQLPYPLNVLELHLVV